MFLWCLVSQSILTVFLLFSLTNLSLVNQRWPYLSLCDQNGTFKIFKWHNIIKKEAEEKRQPWLTLTHVLNCGTSHWVPKKVLPTKTELKMLLQSDLIWIAPGLILCFAIITYRASCQIWENCFEIYIDMVMAPAGSQFIFHKVVSNYKWAQFDSLFWNLSILPLVYFLH